MAISSAAAHHRAKIASITRAIRAGEPPTDDPELEQAKRDLHDVLLAERVEKILVDFPKLSEHLQARVVAIFQACVA
jgi:hypothetical protein